MYVYNTVGLMAIALFERFEAMVERLPTRAVVSAVVLERRMLEDDLARKRTMPMEEASSIIAFCNFIENAAEADHAPRVAVPIHHLGFYRATVKRLVEAGELPYETGALFDNAFFPSAIKTLRAA